MSVDDCDSDLLVDHPQICGSQGDNYVVIPYHLYTRTFHTSDIRWYSSTHKNSHKIQKERNYFFLFFINYNLTCIDKQFGSNWVDWLNEMNLVRLGIVCYMPTYVRVFVVTNQYPQSVRYCTVLYLFIRKCAKLANYIQIILIWNFQQNDHQL